MAPPVVVATSGHRATRPKCRSTAASSGVSTVLDAAFSGPAAPSATNLAGRRASLIARRGWAAESPTVTIRLVRRLFPDAAEEVDLHSAYALGGGRPHVRANFVSSLDGSVVLDGRSSGLSSPEDRRVFAALRDLCDVVLVGAGTVRDEGYGPARLSQDRRRWRTHRGMEPVPPVAVVTASMALDFASPFFVEADAAPVVITTRSCPVERVEQARKVSRVVQVGDEAVDVAAALHELSRLGLDRVLLEGGPSLFAEVVAAGALDELCLTLSAALVGPDGFRLAGRTPTSPRRLELIHVLQSGDDLFLRYSCHRPPA